MGAFKVEYVKMSLCHQCLFSFACTVVVFYVIFNWHQLSTCSHLCAVVEALYAHRLGLDDCYFVRLVSTPNPDFVKWIRRCYVVGDLSLVIVA